MSEVKKLVKEQWRDRTVVKVIIRVTQGNTEREATVISQEITGDVRDGVYYNNDPMSIDLAIRKVYDMIRESQLAVIIKDEIKKWLRG